MPGIYSRAIHWLLSLHQGYTSNSAHILLAGLFLGPIRTRFRLHISARTLCMIISPLNIRFHVLRSYDQKTENHKSKARYTSANRPPAREHTLQLYWTVTHRCNNYLLAGYNHLHISSSFFPFITRPFLFKTLFPYLIFSAHLPLLYLLQIFTSPSITHSGIPLSILLLYFST